MIFRHPNFRRPIPVPNHGSKDLGKGLVHKILKQAGLLSQPCPLFSEIDILKNCSMIKKKLTVVLERDADNEWQAWSDVEDTQTLLTAIAPTTEGILQQMRELIANFQQHDWQDVPSWHDVNPQTEIEFEFAYSVLSLFDEFKFLKIGAVAKEAGINAALLRAYACGDKNPSEAQAKKIEAAIRRLGQSLLNVSVVPAQAA